MIKGRLLATLFPSFQGHQRLVGRGVEVVAAGRARAVLAAGQAHGRRAEEDFPGLLEAETDAQHSRNLSDGSAERLVRASGRFGLDAAEHDRHSAGFDGGGGREGELAAELSDADDVTPTFAQLQKKTSSK